MTVLEWYEKEVNALIDKYEAKEISKSDFIVMKHNLFYPAKAMEKEQTIELLKSLVYSVCIGDDVEDVEEWLKKHELNKSE
jgi:hypothetical protein